MGLLAHRVVSLGAKAHRQDVVRKPRGLAPRRRQRDMKSDLGVILEHLHPREAVWIGPQRVVNAREVHVELAAALLQEVRQQETHLVEGERKLLREQQLVPVLRSRRRVRVLRHELVRDVQIHAALFADGSHQDDKEVEAARDLPAPQVSCRGCTPTVGRERRSGFSDRFRRFKNLVRRHAGLEFGVLGREPLILLLQGLLERLKRHRQIGPARLEVRVPVHPALHKRAVVFPRIDQVLRDGQQDGAFGARFRRHPHIRLG